MRKSYRKRSRKVLRGGAPDYKEIGLIVAAVLGVLGASAFIIKKGRTASPSSTQLVEGSVVAAEEATAPASQIRKKKESQLREIFDRTGRNDEGDLTRSGLIRALKADPDLALLLKLPQKIKESDRAVFEPVFQRMDVNQDRVVDANEFLSYFTQPQTTQESPAPVADRAEDSAALATSEVKLLEDEEKGEGGEAAAKQEQEAAAAAKEAEKANLFDAIDKLEVERVKSIISGIDRDTINAVEESSNATPLIKAILSGTKDDEEARVEIVKILLQAGAKIDYTEPRLAVLGEEVGGTTALMYAANAGYEGTVQFLLDAGADSTKKNHEGNTALDLAVDEDHEDIVELLRGDDV